MHKFPVIEVRQRENQFLLTAIPAKLLTIISYAAVRRVDQEEGAVQRILNTSRIAGIKEFATQMGDFPASIVLNWVGEPLNIENGAISIREEERLAQIIDGQHRVAGIKAAIQDDSDVGNIQIPVAIYRNLNTQASARIFISINTEQRPAPKSLVFDLYGIAATDLMDPAALRAGDIVSYLGSEGQPYENWVKLPNAGRQRGGISLSTAVGAVKPLVEAKGILEQIGASQLEVQKAIFRNYFEAIKSKYADDWDDRTNAFIYASGFTGAIEFLRSHMIDYCKNRNSFEKNTINEVIHIDSTNRILQEEVKGLGGTEASGVIRDRLIQAFRPEDVVRGFKV